MGLDSPKLSYNAETAGANCSTVTVPAWVEWTYLRNQSPKSRCGQRREVRKLNKMKKN